MAIRRLLRIEIATLALFAGAFSVARADTTTPLQQGVKALQAGKARDAAKLFTTELETPDISQEERARAFYLRAKAYYAIKQPALAIADVGAALWFKKLSPKDAADAEQLKAEAQRSAAADTGLPDVTPVTGNSSPPVASPASAPAAAPPPPPAPAEPAAQKRSAPQQATLPPPPERQPPSSWSTAAIKSEQLPPPPVVRVEPAKPISPWTTSAQIAAPLPPPQRIETSALAQPVQSSAPNAPIANAPPPQQIVTKAPEQVATAAPQPPAPAPSNTGAQPTLSSAVKSLVPNLSGLGSLFAPEPSPMLAEVDQANELQRRNYEKIRQYNRDAQARNTAQSTNATPAPGDTATAAPTPGH
jgi:hypothetical protein